ncbi:hypothetical protein [Streptomyces massasporeus]|uniref:hypothetical protein n=1 Tax=Streptomyces massasporeus TaxID=67324 RepID=UPI0037F6E5D8
MPAGEWDETALARIVCFFAQVACQKDGSRGDRVSGVPGVWKVRVVCSGRETVAMKTQHGVAHGVERYIT